MYFISFNLHSFIFLKFLLAFQVQIEACGSDARRRKLGARPTGGHQLVQFGRFRVPFHWYPSFLSYFVFETF